MKKLLSALLSATMLLSLSATAFAAETNTPDLSDIAENTIQISEEVQDNGLELTNYDNISEFVKEVQSTYPELPQIEIADYIVEYTGHDVSAMPENDRLEMLGYNSLTTSTSYVKVNEDGEFTEITKEEALIAPIGVDTSSDGYMELTTDFAHRKTSGADKYYTVWAYGKWLKYPAIALSDVLVLGTNGTFDDSLDEFGYANQAFKCTSGCARLTYRDRSVEKDSISDEDLTLKYANYTPYLEFTPISPRCDYCGGGSKDSSFMTYIKYGIITQSTCNIQASYGHKTLGFSGISVGISSKGSPSISVGIGSTISVYNGRAVTVK